MNVLHPAELNRDQTGVGILSNESFLVQDEVSKEVTEERSNKIMEEAKIAPNMTSLPDYE